MTNKFYHNEIVGRITAIRYIEVGQALLFKIENTGDWKEGSM